MGTLLCVFNKLLLLFFIIVTFVLEFLGNKIMLENNFTPDISVKKDNNPMLMAIIIPHFAYSRDLSNLTVSLVLNPFSINSFSAGVR